MALVSIDQLELGMTLSGDVKDISSRLLLSKGQRIEAKHLRLLKMWGIFEVPVEGQKVAARAPHPVVNADQFNAAGQSLIKLFSQVDIEHPAIQEIVKLAIPYRAGRLKKDPAAGEIPSRAQGSSPMPAKDVTAAIERIDIKLPEVPSLVFELNETIADPLSSSADIARLVNQSPSLAATLLKIVNSAFYGFRSRIDSIPRAIVMIGSREVSSLALGITIMAAFKDIPRKVLDVASFMEHNLACGIVARILAAHGNIAGTEQLFVSGMLHDIGRLVVCKYFPQVVTTLLNHARTAGEPLLKTERTLAGFTHTQIGRKLIQKWKLPYALENIVHYHHAPSSSPNPESAAVVQVADIIVHGLGIGQSGEHKIPGFDSRAWERIKLPAGALPSVIQQATHQIDNFRKVFAGD